MRRAPGMNEVHAVIAFDLGLKRIGIAAGDTLTKTASPRPAIQVTHSGPDWSAIGRELAAHSPKVLVLGAPYNVDGTAGTLEPACAAFALELTRRFGLAVERVDERFSSIEASAALKSQRASGQRRRIRREHIDSAAAAVILERWLSGEGEKQ
jgi:putative Holliday junction resolvase